MERQVQKALEIAGDHAGAFLWRRICRDLAGTLRVAIGGRDGGTTDRLLQSVEGVGPRVDWVQLAVDFSDEGDIAPLLGTQDRLLGTHVLVWATPITAALTARERDAIAALDEAGAPLRRAVVLADAHLLERLSDDPVREGEEVRARVRTLLPPGWELVDSNAVGDWLSSAKGDLKVLTDARRSTVARLLLADATERITDAVSRASDELDEVDGLLNAEDSELAKARKGAERSATHMLGAIRRETEQLTIDLREFLHELESDVPGQILAVEDLDVVRRALPHWLHHVVEHWLSDRLGQWRAAVLADLAEVRVEESDVTRAELLVPAVHPAPLRGESQWMTRIGATAAVGGGAALLVLGMWIPGLVAVSGGILWSALGDVGKEAATRARLTQTAVDALRKMGHDADRLLHDQITQLEEELDRLGEARVAAVAESRRDQRAALEETRAFRRARVGDLSAVREALEERIEALSLERAV